MMGRKGTEHEEAKGKCRGGERGGPRLEAELSVQMGFVIPLKKAQEIAAGERKRAFLVSLPKAWSTAQQPTITWELVEQVEP